MWTFTTTCVNSTAELIDALIESEREIAYCTFRCLLGGEELDRWAREMLYDTGHERGGLRLCNDWHVTYYRGVYDGRPALFLRHSGIEHIWSSDAFDCAPSEVK